MPPSPGLRTRGGHVASTQARDARTGAPDWRFKDYRCPSVMRDGKRCGKLLGHFEWRTDSMVIVEIECKRCGQTHPLHLGEREKADPGGSARSQ